MNLLSSFADDNEDDEEERETVDGIEMLDDDEDNENGHAPNGHAKALPDVLVKAADWLQTHAPPPASATR